MSPSPGVVTAAASPDVPQFERSPATISGLEVEILAGYPPQVTAILSGHLPDACSTVESVEERFDPDRRTYRLGVSAARPVDVACAQVLTPFEVSIPLVEAGLRTGGFVVTAGDASDGFEIQPAGEFPSLELPSPGESVWVCFLEPNLCFVPPAEWRRADRAPTWIGPDYLSARLGVRFHAAALSDPASLLPGECEIHQTTAARVAGAIGRRFAVRRGDLWSEHLFVPCRGERWCELWLEAPSEPLLDAAGEAFWRLARFAIRY